MSVLDAARSGPPPSFRATQAVVRTAGLPLSGNSLEIAAHWNRGVPP